MFFEVDEDSLTGGTQAEVVLVEVGREVGQPVGVLEVLKVLPFLFGG